MRAISSFSLEAGTSTLGWCAWIALRTRARKSATGSVKLMFIALLISRVSSRWRTCRENFKLQFRVSSFKFRAVLFLKLETRNLKLLYQDDLETPGISPLSARPRKHRRQMPNLRRYPRGRPH